MRKTTTILIIFTFVILGVWLLQNNFAQAVQAAPAMPPSAMPTNSSPNDLASVEWESIQAQITANTLNNPSWLQQAKLAPGDSASDDGIGYSIAVSGDTAVIGAAGDDENGVDSGAAYIFTRNGTIWSQQAKLTANDGVAGNRFGDQVAIDDDTVIVSSYGNFGSVGSVYVFTRNGTTWNQQVKLTAADGDPYDQFGGSLALDGNTVVIGARLYRYDNNGNGNNGAAYIFTRTGAIWSEQALLTAFDGANSDYFGNSVAIFGNTVVIGAPNDDDNGNLSGSAYVFTGSGATWSLQQKLIADDGVANDQFGFSVAINEDDITVGGVNTAYVFTRNGAAWTQQAKLTASDVIDGDGFGRSVAIQGSAVVVGAPFHDNGGAAYIFTRNNTTWTQQAKLSANDGAYGDEFGVGVTVDSNTVVVGAHFNNDSGSAYAFIKATSEAVIGSEGGIFTPTNTITFSFPPSAFLEPVTVTHTTIPSVTAVMPGVGIFYELTAVYVSNNQPASLEPGQTFTTVVQYDEANLPTGVSEDSLKLFYQTSGGASLQSDAATAAWEPAASSVVDTVRNEITAVDSRLGTWAVFSAGYEVYLPVLIKP